MLLFKLMLPRPEWPTFSEQTGYLFCCGNIYKTALCRQCDCRVCLAIKELHMRVQLTEQRSARAGEDETRWMKASTGRVTKSALGPR